MWNLKNYANELIHKTQTHRLTDIKNKLMKKKKKNKLMVTKGEKGWGGINQELGINRYTLLYMNKKVQLHGIGNQIQYLMIPYNGKESEKVHVHIYMNHFAIHQKLTAR